MILQKNRLPDLPRLSGYLQIKVQKEPICLKKADYFLPFCEGEVFFPSAQQGY